MCLLIKTKSLQEINKILKDHKEELYKNYRVKEIGIFGSFVSSEQKKGSDLDMIIEFSDESSIGGFEYIGLMTELEEYLQKIVNINPYIASKRHALSSDKWKGIEKEIFYVFRV